MVRDGTPFPSAHFFCAEETFRGFPPLDGSRGSQRVEDPLVFGQGIELTPAGVSRAPPPFGFACLSAGRTVPFPQTAR